MKEGDAVQRARPESQARNGHQAPVIAHAWLLRGISVNFDESLLIIGSHLQAALKDVVSSLCLLSPHLKQCHHDLQKEAPIKRKELLLTGSRYHFNPSSHGIVADVECACRSRVRKPVIRLRGSFRATSLPRPLTRKRLMLIPAHPTNS